MAFILVFGRLSGKIINYSTRGMQCYKAEKTRSREVILPVSYKHSGHDLSRPRFLYNAATVVREVVQLELLDDLVSPFQFQFSLLSDL
jgi:hypothetical protein